MGRYNPLKIQPAVGALVSGTHRAWTQHSAYLGTLQSSSKRKISLSITKLFPHTHTHTCGAPLPALWPPPTHLYPTTLPQETSSTPASLIPLLQDVALLWSHDSCTGAHACLSLRILRGTLFSVPLHSCLQRMAPLHRWMKAALTSLLVSVVTAHLLTLLYFKGLLVCAALSRGGASSHPLFLLFFLPTSHFTLSRLQVFQTLVASSSWWQSLVSTLMHHSFVLTNLGWWLICVIEIKLLNWAVPPKRVVG